MLVALWISFYLGMLVSKKDKVKKEKEKYIFFLLVLLVSWTMLIFYTR